MATYYFNIFALRKFVTKNSNNNNFVPDICMIQFTPSVVACACILLARQQLRLTYRWTTELTVVTKYDFDDLTICANAILR